MDNYLMHHGILDQKWGVRRYQNADGSLTPAGKKRLMKADKKWEKKQEKTTVKRLTKAAKKSDAMRNYDAKLRRSMKVRNKNGGLNKNYIAAYNQGLAKLMNIKVKELNAYSPSGMTLAFVAKRGEVGVFTALATPSYDMSKVQRGVGADGRVAYKKEKVEMI